MSVKRTWFQSKTAAIVRSYLFVAGSILLAACIRHSLTPILGRRAPFIMFLPAVVFSAWVGGWGGALMALIVSALLGSYLFISPQNTLAVPDQIDQTTLVIFLIVGLSVSAISSSQRKAEQRARESAEEARARADREALVNEVGHAVLWSDDDLAPHSAALKRLGERLAVDRCFYVLYDEDQNTAVIEKDWRADGIASLEGEWNLAEREISSSEIYPEGRTVVMRDVLASPLPQTLVDLFVQTGQRSYIAVPFFDQSRPRAALTVMMATEARDWTIEEVMMVEAVAVQVRGAMKMARAAQRERNISQQLQKALQPRLPESAPGLLLASRYQAALREAGVGGDFYDVFAVGEDCTALVVGDVSGKGLAAAAQVATVRNMLRAFLYSQPTLAAAVNDLNHVVAANGLLSGFATLFVGCYDAKTRVLTYVNCGQEPALVRREKTGTVEELAPTGSVLGMDDTPRFAEHMVTLAPGDMLAIFTDGVTECGASRHNMLGIEGAKALLELPLSSDENQQGAAEAAAVRLMDGVDAASRGGVARDDVCLLTAVITPR
ncbi:hypothetical protein CCAX7_24990 [Capsulimonas corticalis]|uniref:Uncharacterized protein n=1 Tax=Capsulimonas corticalis TaxID=2219043 RepID=A0A402CVL8_9BACT|nr:SpoIIE family protein phosphatase [Capsulimonas corticalis]BDI30448.1 hypothetical protein CCAX7_24990 [Capsulimonas corticalis]